MEGKSTNYFVHTQILNETLAQYCTSYGPLVNVKASLCEVGMALRGTNIQFIHRVGEKVVLLNNMSVPFFFFSSF